MRRAVLLAVLLGLGLAAGVAVSRAGVSNGVDTTTTATPQVTVSVVSVVNKAGIIAVTLSCPAAGAGCTGTYQVPEYDQPFKFSIAAGKRGTYQVFLSPPDKPKAATAKTIRVVLTQSLATSDRTYPLAQQAASSGGGGANDQNNGGGPFISAGPASRTETVKDPRGDNRSSFPLPIVYDIVSASAKRNGNAIVFSITTVQRMTMHDGYGNAVTPCIEIPYGGRDITPIMTFGNGQLPGAGKVLGQPLPHTPPRVSVHISGTTVRWTVPHKYLFKLGFKWRATGGCDVGHLADIAPNKGFQTFRWVTVK